MNWVKGALSYLEAGLSVVPIPKMWDDPEHKDYSYPWAAYKEARMDEAKARKEFARAQGIAIVCGAVSGNLVVIDFDSMAAWDLWKSEMDGYPGIFDRLTIEKSPSGMHVYVRLEDGAEIPRNGKWAMVERDKKPYCAIETRGEGGLIFCAPTPGYSWVQGDWRTIPVLTLDEFGLLEALARSQDDYKDKVSVKYEPVPGVSQSAGDRPGDHFNAKVEWPEMVDMMGGKIVHQTHNRLVLCRPGKSHGTSGTTGNGSRGQDLFYCFTDNWHPFEQGRCYSKFAVWTMLAHGGDYKRSAKAAAERFGLDRKFTTMKNESLEVVAGGAPDENVVQGTTVKKRVKAHEDGYTADDHGNATAFAAFVDGRLKYCAEWGRWIPWNGKKWVTDDVSQVGPISMYTEFLETIHGAWRAECRKRSKINNCIELAKSMGSVPVRPGDFDKDPLLLNMQDGIADFRTGEIFPHDPKYMCSRITKASASCTDEEVDEIARFLNAIVKGRADLLDALHRFVGYSCTGLTRDHKWILGVGRGRNGKSTLTNLMLHALGDYAGVMDAKLILSSKTDRAPYDLEVLRGKRFVKCEEPDARRPLDREFLKSLTAGDAMQVAAKYGHPYMVHPQLKLWLLSNHKPKVEFDYAFAERVYVVPFDMNLEPDQIDRTLEARLEKGAGAFLVWAIEGAMKYMRDGLIETPDMVAEKDSYRENNDYMQDFLNYWTTPDPLGTIELQQLFQLYQEWSRNNNTPRLTKGDLSQRMKVKGFDTALVGYKRLTGYKGIKQRIDPGEDNS